MVRKALILAAILGSGFAFGTTYVHAALDEAIKRNNFGGHLIKEGRLEEALNEFRRAVEIDPNYVAAHRNLAYVYDRLGRTEEAAAAYRKGIELDPKDVVARNNLGVLYDKNGKQEEAIAEFEKALRIDPANVTVLKNLESAKNNQGVLRERTDRIAQARREADARPNDPRAAFHLARVYASFDDIDRALEWLARALTLGFDDLRFVETDPVLLGVRKDPRFTRLLNRH